MPTTDETLFEVRCIRSTFEVFRRRWPSGRTRTGLRKKLDGQTWYEGLRTPKEAMTEIAEQAARILPKRWKTLSA